MGSLNPTQRATDLVVIAGGPLALVASFLPWYAVSATLDGESVFRPDAQTALSAWSARFSAWFAVLLLVAAAVIVLTQAVTGAKVALALGGARLLAAGLAGLAVVMTVMRFVTLPSAEDEFRAVSLPEGTETSAGAGVGLYLNLLVALVVGVAAFLGHRSGEAGVGERPNGAATATDGTATDGTGAESAPAEAAASDSTGSASAESDDGASEAAPSDAPDNDAPESAVEDSAVKDSAAQDRAAAAEGATTESAASDTAQADKPAPQSV